VVFVVSEADDVMLSLHGNQVTPIFALDTQISQETHEQLQLIELPGLSTN